MIDVVIAGAAGRLGRRTLALVHAAADLKIAAALERSTPETAGLDVGSLIGVKDTGVQTTDRIEEIVAGRVLVEMAIPQAAVLHTKRAFEVKAPMVIATTGFSKDDLKKIQGYGETCPVLIAPNLSLGIAVLTDLVARASKSLKEYDLEIVEAHHKKKRDAPSGTAWHLAQSAAKARDQDLDRDVILARAGETGPRGDKEIGIQTIRGGDLAGEHTVYFIGENERLELTHRAQSRDAFAAGAVAAARFLGAPDRKPGLYSMRDILSLT